MTAEKPGQKDIYYEPKGVGLTQKKKQMVWVQLLKRRKKGSTTLD